MVAALLSGWLTGCGTTRWTDTPRTATEQLLVSNAIDQAVNQIDFRELAGKDVYFDDQYLAGIVDEKYVISSLRQHLLANGCVLKEFRDDATYIVEARAGAVGTDRHELLLGVPQVNVPSFLPTPIGVPSSIPEIPFAKSTDQKAIAKIAVFAYNRQTGRPVWQSGITPSHSTAKDTWLAGAGPFQSGTIYKGTNFAGGPLGLPFISEEGGTDEPRPLIPVSAEMVFSEAPKPVESEGVQVAEHQEPISPAASAVVKLPEAEETDEPEPSGSEQPSDDDSFHLLKPLTWFK